MRTLMLCVVGLSLDGTSTWIDLDSGGESARADLFNGDGERIGHATFSQLLEGVRIEVVISDLPPGIHAMYIHTVGVCQGTGFTSVGAHFNPFGKKHGLQSIKGPHAGDLPNFEVREDGTARVEVRSFLLTLRHGKHSLLPSGKTSLVIHERPDDGVTDPTGDAGARIAYGIIVKYGDAYGGHDE